VSDAKAISETYSFSVIISWSNVIKLRVYHVRGSNALWHHDGNEKLRPWGFYIHGCVDGHSCLVIYLICTNNKRASTVESLFIAGVRRYGWPSRARGDFGKENNYVEKQMIFHWGEAHHAYLRGRHVFHIVLAPLILTDIADLCKTSALNDCGWMYVETQ
jgi:hypothetical protein